MKIEDMWALVDAIERNDDQIGQLQRENQRNYEELLRILPDSAKDELVWLYLRTQAGRRQVRRFVKNQDRKIK